MENDKVIWRAYKDFEAYMAEDKEELLHYNRIGTDVTNLPVDIFLDEACSYVQRNHPFWLLFRNSYDEYDENDASDLLPLTISDEPVIPLANYELKIDEYDLDVLKRLIVDHLDILKAYTDDNIHFSLFLDMLLDR